MIVMSDDGPFPVKPDTNEYEVLSFLVANHKYGFSPAQVADNTDISKMSASETMTYFFEKDLIEQVDGTYYVDPDCVDKLKRRLNSLDSVVQLFRSVSDDAYAEDGWEDELPSIDLEADRGEDL